MMVGMKANDCVDDLQDWQWMNGVSAGKCD